MYNKRIEFYKKEEYFVNKKQYSSSIKKTPFKYIIAKKIAKLMLDGFDRNEIYKNVLMRTILR